VIAAAAADCCSVFELSTMCNSETATGATAANASVDGNATQEVSNVQHAHNTVYTIMYDTGMFNLCSDAFYRALVDHFVTCQERACARL
jgi:hypothetical protein